jgi:hypothetical protein
MAKKKISRSDEPVTTPAPASPRLRTTKRPAATSPPAISAGLDASLPHEPLALADDLSRQADGAEPTYDQIAEAAYHRYLQRGGNHGQDFDDWVEAERSLRKRK